MLTFPIKMDYPTRYGLIPINVEFFTRYGLLPTIWTMSFNMWAIPIIVDFTPRCGLWPSNVDHPISFGLSLSMWIFLLLNMEYCHKNQDYPSYLMWTIATNMDCPTRCGLYPSV